MLENIIGNEKAKFMQSYNKLANELNNFKTPDIYNNRNNTNNSREHFLFTSNSKVNYILNENLKINNNYNVSYNNNQKEYISTFKQNQKKFEKWENMKNSLKIIKPLIDNRNNNNVNNEKNLLFEKIRTNINEMKRQFIQEKDKNYFDNKLISPRNKVILFNKKSNINNNNNDNNKNINKNKNNFNKKNINLNINTENYFNMNINTPTSKNKKIDFQTDESKKLFLLFKLNKLNIFIYSLT
jgi:hypothetical protein